MEDESLKTSLAANNKEKDPSANQNRRRAPGRRRSLLRLPRLRKRSKPGAVAGLELEDLARLPSTPGVQSRITCIDYSPTRSQIEEITDLDDFIARHRPEWSAVRWINVDGLTDMNVIRSLAEKYRLHPLAIEDVLHVTHRPKVESYAGDDKYQARVFIIVRMLDLDNGHIRSEQNSIFLGHKTVLTFQEAPGDVWDGIRQRIQTERSRLRANDASFLVHSLLDAIVDHCFPILEHFGDRLEEVELTVLSKPTRHTIQEIHRLKRELLLLRRALWPMREVVSVLQREAHECLSDTTRMYMRDVYDHTVQIIDIIETYREFAMGLTETYMTAISNRMSEVMKVLTVIGTIFIPLTFLAGVYGMNFRHFPELEWRYGYLMFWAVSVIVSGAMIGWFIHRRWL